MHHHPLRVRLAQSVGLLLAGAFLAGCNPDGTVDVDLPGESVETVTALNIEFTPRDLRVPAGRPFTLTLRNADPIPHGLLITRNGQAVVQSEIINGIAEITLEVPALASGGYEFSCPVHPNMTGFIGAG